MKFLLLCLLPSTFCLAAASLGTAFTFQGRLSDGDNAANGLYDFKFFHEMLHQVHDIKVKNGRREFHSKAFLADERRFANLRAEMWSRMRDWLQEGGVLPAADEAMLKSPEKAKASYEAAVKALQEAEAAKKKQ